MSSQDNGGILFSAHRSQSSFRLLELPAEILELLESENPPTLELKTASAPGGFALLQTPTKTYRIQQKNTSNPVMVLQPSAASGSSEPSSETDPMVPKPSVTSIAIISDTLELLEGEAPKTAAKVNKWHEKFAKTRPGKQ